MAHHIFSSVLLFVRVQFLFRLDSFQRPSVVLRSYDRSQSSHYNYLSYNNTLCHRHDLYCFTSWAHSLRWAGFGTGGAGNCSSRPQWGYAHRITMLQLQYISLQTGQCVSTYALARATLEVARRRTRTRAVRQVGRRAANEVLGMFNWGFWSI